MKAFKGLIIAGTLVAVGMGACAVRYREASSGRSAAEVSAFLTELRTASTGSATEMTRVLDLIEANSAATVYYAEAPGAMGPIEVVTPVDLPVLTNTSIGINDLSNIRVFFVDLNEEGNHKNALILQWQVKGESTFKSEVYHNLDLDPGSIEDGEFNVVMARPDGEQVFVRSLDHDEEAEEELAPVIQIELSKVDAQGNETTNLGQISSMEGFSILF